MLHSHGGQTGGSSTRGWGLYGSRLPWGWCLVMGSQTGQRLRRGGGYQLSSWLCWNVAGLLRAVTWCSVHQAAGRTVSILIGQGTQGKEAAIWALWATAGLWWRLIVRAGSLWGATNHQRVVCCRTGAGVSRCDSVCQPRPQPARRHTLFNTTRSRGTLIGCQISQRNCFWFTATQVLISNICIYASVLLVFHRTKGAASLAHRNFTV